MAKIYFYYSAMNSGKSTHLIQTAFNYNERGLSSLVVKPDIDTRDGDPCVVTSRIGLSHPARPIVCDSAESGEHLYSHVAQTRPGVVLVDECQFLGRTIDPLFKIADELDIPVLFYGLRNGFDNESFYSSLKLLTHADKIVEVKTMCWCGSKATHNLLVVDGNVIRHADSNILVGDTNVYHSLCRKHFLKGKYEK